MPDIQIIFGPPGTGKTTKLLEIVDECLQSGIKPEEIAFLSFTRKAAQEASERAVKKFGLDKKSFRYFCTLHSLAYRILGLRKSDVIKEKHLDEIGVQLGLTFSHKYDSNLLPSGNTLGDNYLRLYDISRAKMIKPEVYVKQIFMLDKYINPSGFINFVSVYENYKNHTGLFDYFDFIERCDFVLDSKVMIIDEAQDLTKQQWMFVQNLWRNNDKVYIAGDDDQAIFEWNGADPETLIKLPYPRTVLPKSYRLPVEVYNFSNKLVARIKVRASKTWESTNNKGSVLFVDNLMKLPIEKDDWLFLARNRCFLDELIKLAEIKGVVYRVDGGKWSNDQPYIKAIVAYEHLRKGESITDKEASLVLKFTTKLIRRQSLSSYSWRDFDTKLSLTDSWLDAFDNISIRKKEYVRTLRRNDVSLVKPGNVNITTIHGAKGGEATNVLLSARATYKVQRGYSVNPDAELRIWYTAVTRARQNLFIYDKQNFLTQKLLYF